MASNFLSLSAFVVVSASLVCAGALELVPGAGVVRPSLRVRGSSHNQNRSSSNNSATMMQPPRPSPLGSQQRPETAKVSLANSADPAKATDDNIDLQQMEMPGAVTHLQQEAQEVRQHRANIVQMQQALTADVALLRESSVLQRTSATRRSRAAAQTQLRKTEQLVKDLSAMLRESRISAAVEAKALLSEAIKVRAAADALTSEAAEQLKALAPRSGHYSHHLQQAADKPMEQMEPAAFPTAAVPSTEAVPAGKATEADASEFGTYDNEVGEDDA